MRSLWLTLALVLSGCFGSHGGPPGPGPDAMTPDAAPPPFDARPFDARPPPDATPPPPLDGGTCEQTVADVFGLRCPDLVAVGSDAIVVLHHGIRGCCSTDGSFIQVEALTRPTVVHDWQLTPFWGVCECCDDCDCEGVGIEEEVFIEAPAPGRYNIHAGDFECSFEVVSPEPRSCTMTEPTRAIAPSVLLTDQELTVTITAAAGGGCACTPELTESGGPFTRDYSLMACDCCEVCGCIDFGYEASASFGSKPEGTHELTVAGATHILDVRQRDFCFGGTDFVRTSSVSIISPSAGYTGGGERVHWARVSGTAERCCGSTEAPKVALDDVRSSPERTQLEALLCDLPPCGCGESAPYEAYHALVDLAPGEHTLLLGDSTTTFTVE